MNQISIIFMKKHFFHRTTMKYRIAIFHEFNTLQRMWKNFYLFFVRVFRLQKYFKKSLQFGFANFEFGLVIIRNH